MLIRLEVADKYSRAAFFPPPPPPRGPGGGESGAGAPERNNKSGFQNQWLAVLRTDWAQSRQNRMVSQH